MALAAGCAVVPWLTPAGSVLREHGFIPGRQNLLCDLQQAGEASPICYPRHLPSFFIKANVRNNRAAGKVTSMGMVPGEGRAERQRELNLPPWELWRR